MPEEVGCVRVKNADPPSADGRPPGMSAPPTAAPEAASGHNAANPQNSLGRVFDGTGGAGGTTPGQRGAANANQGN